jgi:hypothetical protein
MAATITPLPNNGVDSSNNPNKLHDHDHHQQGPQQSGSIRSGDVVQHTMEHHRDIVLSIANWFSTMELCYPLMIITSSWYRWLRSTPSLYGWHHLVFVCARPLARPGLSTPSPELDPLSPLARVLASIPFKPTESKLIGPSRNMPTVIQTLLDRGSSSGGTTNLSSSSASTSSASSVINNMLGRRSNNDSGWYGRSVNWICRDSMTSFDHMCIPSITDALLNGSIDQSLITMSKSSLTNDPILQGIIHVIHRRLTSTYSVNPDLLQHHTTYNAFIIRYLPNNEQSAPPFISNQHRSPALCDRCGNPTTISCGQCRLLNAPLQQQVCRKCINERIGEDDTTSMAATISSLDPHVGPHETTTTTTTISIHAAVAAAAASSTSSVRYRQCEASPSTCWTCDVHTRQSPPLVLQCLMCRRITRCCPSCMNLGGGMAICHCIARRARIPV